MALLSPLMFEPAEESLFDLKDEDSELWAIRLENSSDLFTLNSLDGTSTDKMEIEIEFEENPTKLPENQPNATPAQKPKRKRVRNRQRSTKENKQRKQPLYNEDLNLESSRDKKKSIQKSKKCKLYRERVKAEQEHLKKQHEEDVLIIRKITDMYEKSLQDHASKDAEIRKLKETKDKLLQENAAKTIENQNLQVIIKTMMAEIRRMTGGGFHLQHDVNV